MTAPLPVACTVADFDAVLTARAHVRSFAGALGFDREVVEELVVVVSELASNIVKYGRRGRIELTAIDRPEEGMRGIAIAAEDETAPFDLAGSLRDGYDARGKLDPASVYGRGGIGAGLGAVARFSDGLDLVPLAGGGKRIVARRLLGRPRRGSSPSF
ncbi:MAG: ATP-binding protein [Labilithrix sp.]|nr:ATP-binding protein [Labilithrix sp.]MCW5812993.1 ATP-binding protein [Labilithrix sp.]